ncbi:hypothetical protein [Sphingobacterium athyrii]|nr:hypothetical protein [Sphingobacterium athyrii]
MTRLVNIAMKRTTAINQECATAMSIVVLFMVLILYAFTASASRKTIDHRSIQKNTQSHVLASVYVKMVLLDSIVTERGYQDIYGKNMLHVKVTNPCNADSSRFDGLLSHIEVQLKNNKGKTSVTYKHPHPQMSLIQFIQEEIHIKDLGGRKAAIVPFYYCGGYESYDMKVSYIVLYENKSYIFHLDYYCGEGVECKPVRTLQATLKNLPKDIRTYLIRYLTKKHRSRDSFHQE